MNNSVQYNIIGNPNWYITRDSIPNNTNGDVVVNGFRNGDVRDITNHDFIIDHKTNIFFHFGDRFGTKTSISARYWLNIFKDNLLAIGVVKTQIYQHMWALFIESEFTLWDDLFVTMSARANFNSRFGTNLSPRLYLIHNAIDE